MFAPSKARPTGRMTENVPSNAPSLARSLVTLSLLLLATQMFDPSNAKSWGLFPTAMVLTRVPSLALSLVTVLRPEPLATQMYLFPMIRLLGRPPYFSSRT